MFQLNFTSGYQVQVIGKGENGLCRIISSTGFQVKFGTYAECLKWLHERACKMIG